MRVRRTTSSQPGCGSSSCTRERRSGRAPSRHSSTTRFVFVVGANSVGSIPCATRSYRPGKRASAAAATSGVVASSASMRPSSRSRWARPGGYERRSGEKNVAAVRAAQSRSARYERLGSPGSKPCTTSKRPRASASARLARTPTGTPIRLRREIGTAGPSATNSPSNRLSLRKTRLAWARSRARFDGARTVTSWPRCRSSPASAATCSLTSCGCDQANGVTRATRTRLMLWPP